MEVDVEAEEGDTSGSEEDRSRARWSPAQILALDALIRRERDIAMAAGRRPPSTPQLTARAMAELVPGVLGTRRAGSIRHKIISVLNHGVGLSTGGLWTLAQNAALEEFIRQEEERAAAAGKRRPRNGELARRVLRRLVPGVLGHRSWKSVECKIRRFRRGC